MQVSPTAKQAEVLAFIKGYAATTGAAPTVRLIAEALGITSYKLIHMRIDGLVERGHLIRFGGRVWPIYYGKR